MSERVVALGLLMLFGPALCRPVSANDQADRLETALNNTASLADALVGQQLSATGIPQSLPGRWKVSLCINAPGHAWLRYESLRSEKWSQPVDFSHLPAEILNGRS